MILAEVIEILSAIRNQKEQSETKDNTLSIFELILKYKPKNESVKYEERTDDKLDDEDMNSDEDDVEDDDDEDDDAVMDHSHVDDNELVSYSSYSNK